MGAPKEKLNIGLSLFGRSFTLANDFFNGVGDPAFEGGQAGQFTGQSGFLSYYEVSKCRLAVDVLIFLDSVSYSFSSCALYPPPFILFV